jgi:hypothetical protein
MAGVADDIDKESALRDQLTRERRKLQAELEEKKECVRQAAKS